jgi:hypothetical protein
VREEVKPWFAALALAACGHASSTGSQTPGESHATPATCDAIVAHLAVVFEQKDLARTDREDLVASCEKDDPPPAERECVMAAQTQAELDACGREKHAKATPPAPVDPKQDLVALGAAAARYRVELGDPPPAAGPTPAAGACCEAACPADSSQWTGPWQAVRWGLDHATRWSFAIERRADDGGVVVRALGCPGAKSYQIVVAPNATPTAADITESD